MDKAREELEAETRCLADYAAEKTRERAACRDPYHPATRSKGDRHRSRVRAK